MRLLKVVVVAIVAVAVASVGTASAAEAPWGYGGGRLAGSPRPTPMSPTPQAAPAGSSLRYVGGPVVSHASIESVYWGSGTYESGAGPGELPMIEFFQGVTDSRYMDWLSEYDTTNLSRLPDVPAQSIGRGTYQGQTTISPSTSQTTITDNDIADELVRQIDAGLVPRPQLDAAGQVQTLYAMFFPGNMTISAGSMVGGEPGGFCMYHTAAILDNELVIPYMVLPEFESHGFADGCGDDPSLFNNFTAVTSHEIIEAVTDPAPGFGWIDGNSGDEIADICQPQHGTVVGGNGLTHVVSLEFSQELNDCIVSKANLPEPPRNGYVNACGLAGRTGFTDAGLAADCLEQYGIALGKNDGTFGENDGLIRSQVSSLLARLIALSGANLSTTRHFDDVDSLVNAQVTQEIEQLAGAGIIEGFPDGQFHPNDHLSVAQAVTLVMRTLAFIHAPGFSDQDSTGANYLVAIDNGLLNLDASNIRGFSYAGGSSDITARGLLADVLAQAVQKLVDTGAIART